MPTKTLSVIIPTHNRQDALEKVLRGLERQSALEEIQEVLVVDDGSTDDTPGTVSRISKTSPLRIRLLRQDQCGQAAARNRGLREAATNLVLFLDDDIIPRTNLVGGHLAWHRKYPDPGVSVMGPVFWSRELRPTPFMEWFGDRGPFLNYRGLRLGSEVEPSRSYSCNISMKGTFLRRQGAFDEDFRAYGFEDLELAYRLKKAGGKLLYNPEAVGEHYKFITFAAACKRAKQTALARELLDTKEAGAYFSQLSHRTKKSARYRIGNLLIKTVVPFLAPMKPLMDSHVPLPWPVYAAFYHYYKFR